MAGTRRLALIVSARGGALPAILAVTIAPAAACGSSSQVMRAGPLLDATAVEAAADDGPADGDAPSLGAPDADGGTCSFTVDVPSAGVPADPGSICAVAMPTVTSQAAATVTLTRYSASIGLAHGFVAIAPALAADVVGLPQITAVSGDARLANVQITGVQATSGGFSFDARWPALDMLDASLGPTDLASRLALEVTFEVGCAADAGADAGSAADAEAGSATRLVTSTTYFEACQADGVFEWAVGNQCYVCNVVAEMAPSPIVPDKCGDELPLARAVRLRLVVLARIGGSLVLLAENDGGPGQDYAWHASTGAVERVDEDIAVWTPGPEASDPAIQVAVQGPEGAAVAMFVWEQAA
jgi:hypothetical protein